MKKIIIFVAFLTLIFSCGSDGESSQPSSFNVEKLRSEFITQIETPAINAFSQSANSLNTAIVSFTENPSEEKLASLKTKWKGTATSFSAVEILNLGEVKTTLIMSAFYTWGANETAIEDFVAGTGEISSTALNSISTNQRGLAAVEYLLFEKSASETITDFSNKRRKEYLKALGENLVQKATTLTTSWVNYRNTFISNNATGINGGLNMIINQMNALLEDVRRFKIGEPAGLERTTTPNATLLQAEKSAYSLALILANINSVKRSYFETENSIDNYVAYITKSDKLNTKVQEKFTEIDNAIKALASTSLKNEITTKPTEVKKLYEAIKALIVLIKTDVASALSVTVTFTDNDGD